MIDINKKYRFRNGEDARILCVDSGDENYPVIALTREGQTSLHTKSGALWNALWIIEGQHIWDLVEVKEKKTLWVNILPSGVGYAYLCMSEADYQATKHRVARIKVTYEEGQFDE